MSTNQISVGQRLPPVKLARLRADELELVDLEALLSGRRVVLVGIPGAFTPVCTGQHLPSLIAAAPALRAAGFQSIVCVAPNSPWVVAQWASQVDPGGVLEFLSDGNLELAKKTGLTSREPGYFLGECSKRFSMVLDGAVVRKLAVEARIESVTCTAGQAILV